LVHNKSEPIVDLLGFWLRISICPFGSRTFTLPAVLFEQRPKVCSRQCPHGGLSFAEPDGLGDDAAVAGGPLQSGLTEFLGFRPVEQDASFYRPIGELRP